MATREPYDMLQAMYLSLTAASQEASSQGRDLSEVSEEDLAEFLKAPHTMQSVDDEKNPPINDNDARRGREQENGHEQRVQGQTNEQATEQSRKKNVHDKPPIEIVKYPTSLANKSGETTTKTEDDSSL